MCALALAVASFDFGCSLSFDTGPALDAGGPPQNDSGAPDNDHPGNERDGSDAEDGARADTSVPPKQQPPRFINLSTDTPSNQTQFTVSKPAGTVQGDLLLASIYVTDYDNVITLPAGWTFIDQHSIASPCSTTTAWAYHFYTDSDPSTYVFGIKYARALENLALMAYRGVDKPPIGNTQHGVAEFMAPTYGPVSLVTDRPNETLVMMSVRNVDASTSWTTPTGMTPHPATNVLGVFDEPRVNAGATGSRTTTSTGDSSSCGDVELLGLYAAPL